MAKWSRERASTHQPCQACQGRTATRLCDGVLQRPSWHVCNAPLCESCAVRHGAADYCGACGLTRGIIQRDPGEEG
jgi:hypothetical protein